MLDNIAHRADISDIRLCYGNGISCHLYSPYITVSLSSEAFIKFIWNKSQASAGMVLTTEATIYHL